MTTTNTTTAAASTYTVSLGGETYENLSQKEAEEKIAYLVKNYGGIPQITRHEPPTAVPAEPAPAPAPEKVRPQNHDDLTPEMIDATGAARSEADRKALVAAGFSPAQPLFTRGTRLLQIGVDNVRRARQEYEHKPFIGAVCSDIEQRVAAESREDRLVDATRIRMTAGGDVAIGSDRLLLECEAFPSLTRALHMPAGAAPYLSAVEPTLRAININRWNQAKFEEEVADHPEEMRKTLLRTRVTESGRRAVFAAVSERYGAFDADRVAEAVRLGVPETARGEAYYDGRRLKITSLFFTTVPEDEFVAGEFFRAGVMVSTDDTGAGSLRVDAFVEQNLCLNLMIISKDAKPVATIRHLGSVAEVADKIRAAIVKANALLEHFVAEWGYARKEVYAAGELRQGMRASEFFAAHARAIIDADLVPVGVRELPALTEAYEADTSSLGPKAPLTRAGVINAFTRYAQTQDPFRGVEIERAASKLVWAEELPEPIFG